MKITDYRLHHDDNTAYPFRASPNKSGKLSPKYIVLHYTAGSGAKASINWLTNPKARASAHIVIGRDGNITQLVDFKTVAWHAGRSSWKGIKGLNRHSIGIELDNAGPVTRVGDHWKTWFGKEMTNDKVLEAQHKNRSVKQGWHLYTEEQLQAAFELCHLLTTEYDIKEVIGHEDIAPRRKTDPGPAFPMDSFRSHLFGQREVEEQEEETFITTTELNIRAGAGSYFDIIKGSPLPANTEVDILESVGVWHRVDVLDVVNGINDLEGWVHSRYITEK